MYIFMLFLLIFCILKLLCVYDGTQFYNSTGSEICEAWNPVCLGKVYGILGKFKIHSDGEWKLLMIKQERIIGFLPNNIPVYKIEKVGILPLNLEKTTDLEIEMCQKHHFGIKKSVINRIPEGQQKPLQKTWNTLKSAAESVKPKKLPNFKTPLSHIGDLVNPPPQLQKEIKEREKFEKKILEELHKMFSETGSFYYVKDGDLTKSTQSYYSEKDDIVEIDTQISADNMQPDDRFFWNKYMLQDLIETNNPLARTWIVPIIQGYVQIETCTLNFEDQYGSGFDNPPREATSPLYDPVEYKMCIISRRSRYRAGTRYKRRGVDEEGHCANYVETEQIVEFSNHVVSFVQIRGSIPLYWSQTGMKYKPPPRIEKAISTLQKMCNCALESKNIGGTIEEIKEEPMSGIIHALICLAAQMAFERNNRTVALHALDGLVLYSSDHQQVLTALRCLVRLKLTIQEETQAKNNREELQSIRGYIKSAYEKLVCALELDEKASVNIQNEATWFMKIAWNMGLKSGECYDEIEQFFILCKKLQLMCPVDLAALNRHKTCLLMAAAASLQWAKTKCAELEKSDILKQTLQHIQECREVIERIEQLTLSGTEITTPDSTTPVLLILYEFEAKSRLGHTDLEHVLENALAMPQCEAKVFETISALSMEAPSENGSLSTRALKIAIKKHLQDENVNYNNCSRAFHSLISLALQSSSHSDSASREEAWAYFLDVVNLIENKAQGEYPEIEILWLMTKAWNCGIHLFSATKYQDSLQWCELGMKLLKYLGPLKVNYEKQMTTVYSDILAKVETKSHTTMEQ